MSTIYDCHIRRSELAWADLHPAQGVILPDLAKGMIETAMNNRVVHSNPDIMHGTPVFIGTRVPARSLWDYLEAGYSLDEYLDQFPTVKREQAMWLIQQANKRLSEPTESR